MRQFEGCWGILGEAFGRLFPGRAVWGFFCGAAEVILGS